MLYGFIIQALFIKNPAESQVSLWEIVVNVEGSNQIPLGLLDSFVVSAVYLAKFCETVDVIWLYSVSLLQCLNTIFSQT